MRFSIKILLISFFLVFSFSAFQITNFLPPQTAPATVQAGDLWNQQEGMGEVSNEFGASTDNPRDIRAIIIDFVKVFLGFLAIIFLVLVIMAGYKWMTAAGNEEQVKEAKDTLSKAVIGLIIILAAYAITAFIIETIVGTTSDSTIQWDIL